MDRSNDPRGGKEEGTRELIAPPADAVVSEYHRLEPDSGCERGIVQRVKGEGGWSGDAGGGEFASEVGLESRRLLCFREWRWGLLGGASFSYQFAQNFTDVL